MKTTPEPKIVSVFVPFKLTKRGGRKEMILPPANELSRPRHDNTVLKALARAFRWKRMLEDIPLISWGQSSGAHFVRVRRSVPQCRYLALAVMIASATFLGASL